MEDDFTMDVFSFDSEQGEGVVPSDVIFDNTNTPNPTDIPSGLDTDKTDDKDNNTDDEGQENVGDQNDNRGSDDDSESSSNLYSSLAAVIHENGLLPSIDITTEKIKDIDDFTRIMKVEQEAQAKIMLQDYINNLDVAAMAQNTKVVNDLSTIDENYLNENLETAKNLIREDYRNQGFSEDRITRIVNKLVDLGSEDVVNEALAAKNSLIEINAKAIADERTRFEQEKAANIQRQAKVQEDIKKNIFDRENLIEGYKPTPVLKNQVYKAMTEVVGTDAQGNPENKFIAERRQNPAEFEARMYMFYELTNGFKDFKNVGTPAKSSAVNDLERALRGTRINDDSTPTYMQDNQSYAGTNFELNI